MHPRQASCGAARASLAIAVFALIAATGGCSKSTKPVDGLKVPFLYGSEIVPINVDPTLSEAYRTLTSDGERLAHVAISWSAIDLGPGVRDWSSLDRNIHAATTHNGMRMSVLLEFVHGGAADLPAYRWADFPGWDSRDLLPILAAFLREMKGRFPSGDTLHTLAYLWLGEGPDRFAAAFPGDDAAMVHFYTVLADSARRIFPFAHVGTMVTPALVAQNGGTALVQTLRDSLDVLGLSVYPRTVSGIVPDPQPALDAMVAEISSWQGRPIVVLEAGYPSGQDVGSSEERQTTFATILGQWLHGRPSTMEAFCWSPVADPSATIADSLALRRHPPPDSTGRADFERRVRTMSLHRVDGSSKPARHAWIDNRP